MRKINFFIFLLIFCQQLSSQITYQFDNYVVSKIKNNINGYDGNFIQAFSSIDTTYTLEIQKTNVMLKDKKNDSIYIFLINKEIKNIKDLKKLKNPIAINDTENTIDVKKTYYEESFMEFDSINNLKNVKLLIYSDESKNNLILERIYSFKNSKDFNFMESITTKERFIKKFNLDFKKDDNLYKIKTIKDGKITMELEFIEFVNTPFELKFKLQ